MDSYDIDGFGMLESPKPPYNTNPKPTSPQPGPSEAPTSPEPAGAPEIPPVEVGNPVQQTSTSVIGNNNETAGGDLDKSFYKTDLRGAVITTPEFVEQLARAGVQGRNGRGIQDPEALERLADKYVAPPQLLGETPDGEHDTAFQILTSRKVLFLGAPARDCGQLSAALRLGQELRQEEDARLIVREELMDPSLRLHHDGLLVEHEPAAVIIDLRGASENDLQTVRRSLVEFSSDLWRYESYLILIIPPGSERSFEDSFPDRVHLLQQPPALKVFASHVGRPDAHELVISAEAEGQLEEMWPPKIKAIADAVRDGTDRGEQPLQAIQRALEREASDLPSELRKEILTKQQENDPEWLAMLLAVSLLEGAPPQHIARASDQLLLHNKIRPPEEIPPLLRPSPYTRLLRLPDNWFDIGRRELLPSGFGKQVLRHFWREHPDVQESLLTWFGELPRSMREFERGELEQIADRAAELAAEGGSKIAVSLAIEWATTNSGTESGGLQTSTSQSARYRRSVAVRLLTTTATDSSLGRDVRQQLWDWSRDGNADRKLLAAEVCAGLGEAFPRMALTRLKHLANGENTDVRAAVLRAVRQIGTEIGASRFLRYLSEWFHRASPARLSVISESVSSVLTDHAENIDTDAATSFWHHALDTMPPEDLRMLLESWLRAATTLRPDERTCMVEPIVQATDCTPLRIAHVDYASRFGRPSLDMSSLRNDPVAELVDQLWTRLDEVDPVWTSE
ncbi:hypothetical protein [Saccharopolyspora mangrovi]|uniref:HEAT repeat domain-containing protein n=1 Tax=Saccharopolyspora mangrovi TaxID=3082379 RepID=A0ABU6AK16_9PSEU|nr:hypothetical protein [Saccharopolyspora sp. S2-29]MEB3371919.1 hypothetical protein [Saccharopolyspora sp. S2-29]